MPTVASTTVAAKGISLFHRRKWRFYVRSQTTVENCIGGHTNVSSDYKKTQPSKILTFFHSKCHYLIDMLTKFCQTHILPALLKRPDVRWPSILTKIAMYSCADVAHGRKNSHKSLRLLNSKKMRGTYLVSRSAY